METLPIDDGAGQFCVPGFGGPHDLGGVESLMGHVVNTAPDAPLQFWEQQTHALLVQLVSKKLLTVDELRRNVEALEPEHYEAWTYYEKWAVSIALGLIERGVVTPVELDTALGETGAREEPLAPPKYSTGQTVRVRKENKLSRWRKPHLRTPGYIFGCTGVVTSYEGLFKDPEFLAFRSFAGQQAHLYRVCFAREQVWPEAEVSLVKTGTKRDAQGEKADGRRTGSPSVPESTLGGSLQDTVTVEVYESWLMMDQGGGDPPHSSLGSGGASSSTAPLPAPLPQPPLQASDSTPTQPSPSDHQASPSHPQSADGHDHDHHDHDHDHEGRAVVEQRAVDSEGRERPGQRVATALVEVCVGRGLVDRDELRKGIEANESAGRRLDGAALVARAWVDEAFKARLLADATAAALELGVVATNTTTPTKLKVVESSPNVHNLVVCTLCSCYPISLLGLSPSWYKSRSYRARAVREPRQMLRDSFELDLPPHTQLRVHDSTADLRFLVLPARPEGTDGWSEEALKKLVTRDSMIGVSVPKVD